DFADGDGDLGDRAAGLVGGPGHLARGVADARGGRVDAAHDPAQVFDQAVERDAEDVLLGTRLHRHRQVTVGDGFSGVGLLAQVLDRAFEGGGQAADLIVALDVHADVDVTLGDALG